MKNTRSEPSVLRASAIGAVACEHCGGVHIDFLDDDNNIAATGFLDFGAFVMLTETINREVADILFSEPKQ